MAAVAARRLPPAEPSSRELYLEALDQVRDLREQGLEQEALEVLAHLLEGLEAVARDRAR